MRLYKFLQENSNPYIDTLVKDCKPFLKDWYSVNRLQDIVLWHGTNASVPPPYQKFKNSKNRKPRNTPTVIHKWLDDLYQKKFGIKLRSETIFTSHKADVADYYGPEYVFLPIGNYKLYAHNTQADLFGDLFQNVGDFIESKILQNSGQSLPELFKKYNIYVDAVPARWLRDLGQELLNINYCFWSASKIKPAMELDDYDLKIENNELHIAGDNKKSHTFNYNETAKFLKPIGKHIKDELEKKVLDVKQISLAEANKTRNEVMAYCDEYYLISDRVIRGLAPEIMTQL